MRVVKFTLLLMVVSTISYALASQVPVEDLSQSMGVSSNPISQPVVTPTAQPLSADQRLAKLEQQMQNYTQMNLPQKLDALQQQLQQLQGQLDVQAHDLQLLNKQLRDFYQDLDQRIKQAKTLSAADGNSSAPTGVSAAKDAVFSKDRQSYQAAFTLLRNKKYAEAITKLQDYLTSYPNGKYAVNANYWLGELYYLQSHFNQAAVAFKTVIDKYPKSAKVADAMYKLAMIHKIQGQPVAQVHSEFMQVKQRFPNSAAARLADQALQNSVSS